jgi:hypothetical protein
VSRDEQTSDDRQRRPDHTAVLVRRVH